MITDLKIYFIPIIKTHHLCIHQQNLTVPRVLNYPDKIPHQFIILMSFYQK